MSRVSLKVVGASGQGIDSIGSILGKGLKRAGYCVFGYREYPSLIKGGHASYQVDVSDEKIQSTELKVDLLITLNHHGLELNLGELKPGGIIVHQSPNWNFKPEEQKLLDEQKIRVIELPVEQILQKLQAKPILGNVLIAAFVWAAAKQDKELLKQMVGERFAKKKDLLELNMRCIDEGYGYADPVHGALTLEFPVRSDEWKDQLYLRGAEAMGMGAIHAGVRLYAGYPMTPSSPILAYIADQQNKTGMVIKQAEDEITAAQMVSGAMHMGTRALTATSGGGFDLMSETLSLNGILENPTVFILAQRPGPATGLPTWTGQADLLMAIHTGHGEFTRCILSVSDAQDSFDLMPVAFNLAEEFQISVIVLTDKQIAEALYTERPFDQSATEIKRGSRLVTDAKKLKALQSSDRYDPDTIDGVSQRWLPGHEAAQYAAQGDEHDGSGTVDESAMNAAAQIEKRMKKEAALKEILPQPRLTSHLAPGQTGTETLEETLEILVVGWGSTKDVMMDLLKEPEFAGKVHYLHYAYLWPLKTDWFVEYAQKAKKVIIIEGNHNAQLAMLLRQECGYEIPYKILKYDGRPFFYDELRDALKKVIASKEQSSRMVLVTPAFHHP